MTQVTIFTGKNKELVAKEMEALENTVLHKDYNTMVHYTLLPQIIKSEIERAASLGKDLALFTHIDEVILATYHVAKPNVRLIRIVEKDGKVYKAELDSEKLGIAIRGGIEIR